VHCDPSVIHGTVGSTVGGGWVVVGGGGGGFTGGWVVVVERGGWVVDVADGVSGVGDSDGVVAGGVVVVDGGAVVDVWVTTGGGAGLGPFDLTSALMPKAAAPMTATTATPTATIVPVDAPPLAAPADAPPDAPPDDPPEDAPAEPDPAVAPELPEAAAAPPAAAAPAANIMLAGIDGGLTITAADAQFAPATAAWATVSPATPPSKWRPKALVALGLDAVWGTPDGGLACASSSLTSSPKLLVSPMYILRKDSFDRMMSTEALRASMPKALPISAGLYPSTALSHSTVLYRSLSA